MKAPNGSVPYYIDLLHMELTRRKQGNPRYSMRAFSRFLKVDPSALSRILSGKSEISIPICLRILDKLSLPEDQKFLFASSVANAKLEAIWKKLLTRSIPNHRILTPELWIQENLGARGTPYFQEIHSHIQCNPIYISSEGHCFYVTLTYVNPKPKSAEGARA